jgi:type I restriction-modification system DNA methylase subunit
MNYKEVIESRYNRQNWQLLLHDIFGNKIKFWNTPSTIPTSSQFAKQALWLGTITLSDNQTISIYEVELSDSVDIERNRRGIRDMLLTDWRNNGNAGAFMFCYRKKESVLRFSYVSEAWTFADDGSYQKESTDAKRFTYLLGEGHRSRTAIQQFEKLRDSSLTLKDLTKAFSVDAVSDMFFDGYKKQYEDIIQYITGKRMVKVANKWEEQIKNDPCEEIMQEFAHFPNPEKAVRDYVKKLMGRLVFLQFLQKKGWLGVPAGAEWGTGDAEFIQTLFAQCQDKDHFIDNVLESLFNDLNSENEKQLPQYRTPYLNGGLFERDATDETEFPLPAKYMQSLLDFFASYNFTIDENDPDDAEVGVDPEMLGRIFENLLEDNKDKGAFYTPKEIVSYMCRESLISYLQTGIEDETTKEAICQFVITHDVATLGTNDRFRQQVDEALKNVKICDPAIGSGAFPMGLLKELFQCRTALEGISQHQAAEIKKHIIQQNIYGVDIERGAVDIARLRFWLSLIVDEETPQALPNLDFKIMQGNSLLEQYKGVDLSTMTEKKADESGMLSIFDSMLDVYRLDLRKMLAKYYDCTDHHEKRSLRKEIVENVKKQLKEQGINVDFGDLDLSGNSQFMLWHTWFYDVFSKGGFDIVIANPPYIDSESMTNQGMGLLRDILVGKFELSGNWDMYMAFFEQSFAVSGNIVCFITPDKWLSKPFGNKFRATRLKEQLQSILRAGSKVFENATVDAIITLFVSKSESMRTLKFNEQKQVEKITQIEKSLLVEPYYIDYLFSDSANIIEKFERHNNPLSIIATCENACATSDCYALLPYIHNDSQQNSGSYKLINTGTIGKYYSRWGEKECTYLKHKFMYPVVNIKEFEAAADLGKTYKKRAKLPKIIMKGLNLMDACLDERSEILPGKTTLVIYSDNITHLYFLLAILNSKAASFYIKTKYSSSSYCGGITFTKDMINKMPIPKRVEIETIIINKVKDVIAIKSENKFSNTYDIEEEINSLIYQLYGLTYDEVLIIDPNTSITREDYELNSI